jgi:hypothetical protein
MWSTTCSLLTTRRHVQPALKASLLRLRAEQPFRTRRLCFNLYAKSRCRLSERNEIGILRFDERKDVESEFLFELSSAPSGASLSLRDSTGLPSGIHRGTASLRPTVKFRLRHIGSVAALCLATRVRTPYEIQSLRAFRIPSDGFDSSFR